MKRTAIASLALCAAMGGSAAPAVRQAAAAGQAPTTPASAPSTASPPTAPAHPPVVFTPHYTPGETLRYQVSFRSQTQNLVGGAVENPEGAVELGIEVGLTLRLEALEPIPTAAGATPEPAPAPGAGERAPLRLRAIYEHVAATVTGDSYDPAAAKLLAQYQHLEGRSIEFQLGPHGELEYLKGLEEVAQDPRALEGARAWIEQLGAGLSVPQTGAVPGQSWERSQPVPDAPLNGTSLQTISTYLGDEACDVEKPAGEQCAVVLTRFTLGQKPGEKNATPETFRRNGLRTSGEWRSHGESLVYVSLRTGRTMSVSQTSDVLMDLNIRHEDGGTPFHFAGSSKSETHLLLLNAQPGQ